MKISTGGGGGGPSIPYGNPVLTTGVGGRAELSAVDVAMTAAPVVLVGAGAVSLDPQAIDMAAMATLSRGAIVFARLNRDRAVSGDIRNEKIMLAVRCKPA